MIICYSRYSTGALICFQIAHELLTVIIKSLSKSVQGHMETLSQGTDTGIA